MARYLLTLRVEFEALDAPEARREAVQALARLGYALSNPERGDGVSRAAARAGAVVKLQRLCTDDEPVAVALD